MSKSRMDREKRERQWQTWLAALEADRVRADKTPWFPEEGPHVYVKPKWTSVDSHMAYYLRTGRKFMDLQEAFYAIQSRIFPTPQPRLRCQLCRDKKTPGRKLSLKRIMFPDASPLPLPLA